MIVDTMTKAEVMRSIRDAFDNYCYPVFESKLLKYRAVAFKQIGRSNSAVKRTLRYPTPDGLSFELQLTITKKRYLAMFYLSFHWRGRLCFALLTDNGAVDVFQSHALERYYERVLDDEAAERGLKQLLDTIAPTMDHRFTILLPTPTHRLSHYFAASGALFLGDYDPSINEPFFWHNTCISPNEMGRSQSLIVKALNDLATAILKIGINPFLSKSADDKSEIEMRAYLTKNPVFLPHYIELLKTELLLLSLEDVFDIPEHDDEESKKSINYLKEKLLGYGIVPSEYIQARHKDIETMVTEIAFRGNH